MASRFIDLMIDLEIVGLFVDRANCLGADPVVEDARPVGQTDAPLYGAGDRADAVGRDLVIGKCISREPTQSILASCVRVVNGSLHDRPSQRVGPQLIAREEFAEVAAAHGLRGDGSRRSGGSISEFVNVG